MKQEQVLKYLQTGGTKSNEAIKYLFKHLALRRQLSQSIAPYADTLKNHFPINQSISTLEGNKTYQIHDALNYFLSESILKLAEKVEDGTFQGREFNALKTFIITTGNRMCRDWLRKKRLQSQRERPHEDIASVNTQLENAPDESMMQKEKHHQLRLILAQIGKHCKQILLMKYDDYSDDEIVKATGLKNRNAVKSTRRRCMERLEKLIREQPGLLN